MQTRLSYVVIDNQQMYYEVITKTAEKIELEKAYKYTDIYVEIVCNVNFPQWRFAVCGYQVVLEM